MKFILTIDTEGDNQWDHGRKVTVENIKFIPRFQDLCDRYSIKPTYLVTSEVCEDNYACELFSGYLLDGKAEVGAHLHSWTTPPFLDREGFRYNDPNHAFATELPLDILSEKIANLTYQIERAFNRRPLSFRSGRYGFNDDVAEILIKNSYIVDSSVTPYIDWSPHAGVPGVRGGPDFIDSLPLPYNHNYNGKSILEIPITVMPTKFPLNRSMALARSYFRNVDNNIILKILRKLFYNEQPVWLRPTPETDIGLLNELLNETKNKDLPFITMMFHSSELMPGCSKYRPDEASVEELFKLLENFFTTLSYKGIGSVTLTEAATGYSV
jgi:hypothetical protein